MANTIDNLLDALNEDNLAESLGDIGQTLSGFFASGLPAQLGDKVQNATTGLSEAFRIYGDYREAIGVAVKAGDVEGAKVAILGAKAFLEDTARFFAMSSGVDDFRRNSYIWAKKWCSPEAAESMGATDGTPADYQ